MRSDSLTRSSWMPRITVRPWANAAATNRIGYSSIIAGASSGGTSIPVSGPATAVMSATGSPPTAPHMTMVRSAPIIASARSRPSRVGLTPTPRTVTRLPGTISAATSRNAAAEMSPGTVSRCGRSSASPVIVMARPAGVSVQRSSAPKPASMRSLWSRVGTASITVVRPGAFNPASSKADFTCAEATGDT